MVILTGNEMSKFVSKVDIRTRDECWNWEASYMNTGYGQFVIRRNKKTLALSAHRTSFTIFKGDIPKGKQINHTCDNKHCVNPNHLYAGTQSENCYDTVRRGRHKSNNLIGTKNPKAKLSEADVIEIRYLYESNIMTNGQLAKKYHLTSAGIYCIVNRKCWKHI